MCASEDAIKRAKMPSTEWEEMLLADHTTSRTYRELLKLHSEKTDNRTRSALLTDRETHVTPTTRHRFIPAEVAATKGTETEGQKQKILSAGEDVETPEPLCTDVRDAKGAVAVGVIFRAPRTPHDRRFHSRANPRATEDRNSDVDSYLRVHGNSTHGG